MRQLFSACDRGRGGRGRSAEPVGRGRGRGRKRVWNSDDDEFSSEAPTSEEEEEADRPEYEGEPVRKPGMERMRRLWRFRSECWDLMCGFSRRIGQSTRCACPQSCSALQDEKMRKAKDDAGYDSEVEALKKCALPL